MIFLFRQNLIWYINSFLTYYPPEVVLYYKPRNAFADKKTLSTPLTWNIINCALGPHLLAYSDIYLHRTHLYYIYIAIFISIVLWVPIYLHIQTFACILGKKMHSHHLSATSVLAMIIRLEGSGHFVHTFNLETWNLSLKERKYIVSDHPLICLSFQFVWLKRCLNAA